MPKKHKKGKFPIWSCIVGGFAILCGILAGNFLAAHIATNNPEGLGEIIGGYMFMGSITLALAIVFGVAGIILFVILIFIWGR